MRSTGPAGLTGPASGPNPHNHSTQTTLTVTEAGPAGLQSSFSAHNKTLKFHLADRPAREHRDLTQNNFKSVKRGQSI